MYNRSLPGIRVQTKIFEFMKSLNYYFKYYTIDQFNTIIN